MRAHEGDYAHVNGLEMYYEIHGTGELLILLHGGVRLFDHPGAEPIDLESMRVVETPGVTHLRFRVVKDG